LDAKVIESVIEWLSFDELEIILIEVLSIEYVNVPELDADLDKNWYMNWFFEFDQAA
jgi:hypothetical protein